MTISNRRVRRVCLTLLCAYSHITCNVHDQGVSRVLLIRRLPINFFARCSYKYYRLWTSDLLLIWFQRLDFRESRITSNMQVFKVFWGAVSYMYFGWKEVSQWMYSCWFCRAHLYSGACKWHSCCKCINVLYLLISISFHFSMYTDWIGGNKGESTETNARLGSKLTSIR